MKAIFMKDTTVSGTKVKKGQHLKQLKNKKWNIFDLEDNTKKVGQVENIAIQPLLKKGTVLQIHNKPKED